MIEFNTIINNEDKVYRLKVEVKPYDNYFLWKIINTDTGDRRISGEAKSVDEAMEKVTKILRRLYGNKG